MRLKWNVERGIYVLVTLVAAGAFLYWFFHDPVRQFTINEPGLDNRPPVDTSGSDSVIIGEKFKKYEDLTTHLTGKWPHFRGEDFDNISKEKIPLIDHFPATGPAIAWKAELGEGHAAPAVYNGRVYLLDYDERKKDDVLRCFSLETGKELWRRWYAVNIKRNHGMSRTIPAVTDKYVVTIGPKCQVMCCNPITGDLLWGLDLVKEFRTEVPLWYTGQCPLIDHDVAIIAPGGTALLVGIDCATGKILWKTPNPSKLKMSHSSVMPMNLGGKKMYVYAALGAVCGISAEREDAGKLLWKSEKFNPSVLAPSPVILPNGKIFLTAGYGAGAALIQVVQSGETYSVNLIQMYKPSEGLASEQQTPLFYKGYLFGIQPKDGGTVRNQFVCCSPLDCKKLLWTSSKSDRYGLGPYLVADDKFFILSDDGTLSIAKASTKSFEFLDKAKLMDGQDAWGPMAVVDGRLLLRDSKTLLCLNIRK